MMRADAGLHADQAWRQVGKSRLDLATRPLLPQHDRTSPLLAYEVKRVLTDVDADDGHSGMETGHGVPLFGAPSQLQTLAALELGRTIPLPEPLDEMNTFSSLNFQRWP